MHAREATPRFRSFVFGLKAAKVFELLGGDIPSIRSDEFGVQGIAQFNEHLDVEGGVRELSRTQRSLRPVRGAVALLEFKAGSLATSAARLTRSRPRIRPATSVSNSA